MYLNTLRTYRHSEKQGERNVELIWLMRGLLPCFRTIAGFGADDPEAFRNTFRYFVSGLNKSGFLGRNAVAIDDTPSLGPSLNQAGKTIPGNLRCPSTDLEHNLGTIKRQWGYDHIIFKILRKNDGEIGLIYLDYNLRRISNILGPESAKNVSKRPFF